MLEAFTLREDGWSLLDIFEDDDSIQDETFAAVAFSLGELWT
ncbi:MAG: hypothetical protein V9G64_01460 [Candidatus Competibacter sp.]